MVGGSVCDGDARRDVGERKQVASRERVLVRCRTLSHVSLQLRVVLFKYHAKAWRWNFFSPPPTPNLSNLLIEASIYCCLYALNEELKGYPILLSDS
jgi:hypothetical protein